VCLKSFCKKLFRHTDANFLIYCIMGAQKFNFAHKFPKIVYCPQISLIKIFEEKNSFLLERRVATCCGTLCQSSALKAKDNAMLVLAHCISRG